MTPPARVSAFALLFYLVLSLVVTLVVIDWIWPEWSDTDGPLPAPDAAFGLVQSVVLLLLLRHPLKRSGETLREMLGSWPPAAARRWSLEAAVGLIGISLASIYALHLPLSYVAPDFVQWLLLDESMVLFWTRGEHHLAASIVNVLVVVVLAPLVEELLFRGLLLPAWTRRWNVRRALILSSLCFAVFHVDPIGAFVFAAVAGLARLRTGSLWLPILLHAANNALVVAMSLVEYAVTGEVVQSLAEFRASWWIGLAGLLVGAPLLPGVVRRLHALPAAAPEAGFAG